MFHNFVLPKNEIRVGRKIRGHFSCISFELFKYYKLYASFIRLKLSLTVSVKFQDIDDFVKALIDLARMLHTRLVHLINLANK